MTFESPYCRPAAEPITSFTPEPMVTLQQAEAALNIHSWALRRAVAKGLIPGYRPFGRRILVRLSEVNAFIERAKIGGDA